MAKITDNTTSLEEVLAAVNALPDAGGGGGSVETCTVNIKDATGTGRYFALTATVLDDNGHIAYKDVNQASFPYALSNVVVGSPIIMQSLSSTWFFSESNGEGINVIGLRDNNCLLVFSTTTTGDLTFNINTMD